MKYIYINKKALAENHNSKSKLKPVIKIQGDGYNKECFELVFLDKNKEEAGRLIYTPNEKIVGSATLVFQTEYNVVLLDKDGEEM